MGGFSVATASSITCYYQSSLLFGTASKEEGDALANVIETYSCSSGQQINFEKSNIFFSFNTLLENRAIFCDLLGVVDLGKYLGVPSLIGRNRVTVFNMLKDRLWACLSGWEN